MCTCEDVWCVLCIYMCAHARAHLSFLYGYDSDLTKSTDCPEFWAVWTPRGHLCIRGQSYISFLPNSVDVVCSCWRPDPCLSCWCFLKQPLDSLPVEAVSAILKPSISLESTASPVYLVPEGPFLGGPVNVDVQDTLLQHKHGPGVQHPEAFLNSLFT